MLLLRDSISQDWIQGSVLTVPCIKTCDGGREWTMKSRLQSDRQPEAPRSVTRSDPSVIIKAVIAKHCAPCSYTLSLLIFSLPMRRGFGSAFAHHQIPAPATVSGAQEVLSKYSPCELINE